MESTEVLSLVDGVYEINWKEGGYSVASVGRNYYGDVWYAPSNWITIPWYDWSIIKSVTLIQRQDYNDPENPLPNAIIVE